jgi:hypothetical protein
VDTLGVVVVDVLAEQSSQVVLVQDDDVIEEFATYGTDDTFRGSVLPWASKGCPLRVDLEALDRARDGGREDREPAKLAREGRSSTVAAA